MMIDWQQFNQFLLQRMNEKTAEDRMRYAKQFTHVLETGNASELAQLKPDKRIHAMKALSNLAKFTGRYDNWLQLRQRYSLNWSMAQRNWMHSQDSLTTIIRSIQ